MKDLTVVLMENALIEHALDNHRLQQNGLFNTNIKTASQQFGEEESHKELKIHIPDSARTPEEPFNNPNFNGLQS